MNQDIRFSSLLIIFILAFLIPLIISMIKVIRIPEVIGEIIAGVVIGKSGFNVVQDNVWINFLAAFGFSYLMFLSGVEIDFTYFKKANQGRRGNLNPLKLGLSTFAATLLLSFLISVMLSHLGIGINPLILTLIFSTTSLGIVVPTLKETGVIGRPIGQIILISAIIADFSTMLMIPFVMSYAAGKKNSSFLSSLLLVAAFAVIYVIGKILLSRNFTGRSALKTSQWEIRAAFVLFLTLIAVSEFAGVEVILGAFLAGVLFSIFFQKRRADILPKLDAIGYGLLTPFFFIVTGARFDLRTVTADHKAWILLPVLLACKYIAKLIPLISFKKFFGWRKTIGAGFLLSANLSLTIAVSLIALQNGIITESVYSTFLLSAILSCMISPMTFYKFMPVALKKR